MTDDANSTDRDDHDSPWKEALERYFEAFLALLFPAIHAEIDWSRGHRFLDKEFQQIVRDAKIGRRYADKLVSVCRHDGQPAWVLVHVEVQGEAEAAFVERMFVYNYRIRDTYEVPVASLAVLADADRGFRPESFTDALWGCSVDFRFPMVKLLDWDTPARWQALESSDNLFSLVVMAQIRAKATRDAQTRKLWKFRLMPLMYDRGYSRAVVLELFRVIDWMIRLPDALEASFRQELYAFEENRQMPYVTSVERAGIAKGLQQGEQLGYQKGEANLLLLLLTQKFGPASVDAYRERIGSADPQQLETWLPRVLTADTLEGIFR